MNLKITFKSIPFFTLIALIVILTFSQCIVNETESVSFYSVDNQSSVVLYYNIQLTSLSSIEEIEINRGETVEVGKTGELGSQGRAADEFFAGRSNDLSRDIFLFRDSSGVKIVALQLNTEGILNWTQTLTGPNGNGSLFDFTLSVTDDMIK